MNELEIELLKAICDSQKFYKEEILCIGYNNKNNFIQIESVWIAKFNIKIIEESRKGGISFADMLENGMYELVIKQALPTLYKNRIVKKIYTKSIKTTKYTDLEIESELNDNDFFNISKSIYEEIMINKEFQNIDKSFTTTTKRGRL